MTRDLVLRSRLFPAERRADFEQAGYPGRSFFPHRAVMVPKPAPDGYKIAERCGLRPDRGELWQVVLFAHAPVVDEFPDALYFDDEIQWHRQHFGLRGEVATATLLIRGARAYSLTHFSDLVQRIGRRREFRNRIEKVFDGWDRMLLNSILAFAAERRVRTVYTPTADLALRHTDKARNVGRELFDRTYDRHVSAAIAARRTGDWWSVDVGANRRHIVRGELSLETRSVGAIVAVCHDVERGLGHGNSEACFAREADARSDQMVSEMLRIERSLGIQATYNLVGSIYGDLVGPIEQDGHCIGFHTFDHHIDTRAERIRYALARASRGRISATSETPSAQQPLRCRSVDKRVKGYRPAQSRLGPDTSRVRLLRLNFEWLASSRYSLGFAEPRVEDGLVFIPVTLDDFRLHQGGDFGDWRRNVLAERSQRSFFSISLHDCYAAHWIHDYERLLSSVVEEATPMTLDQVAFQEMLSRAA